MGHDLKFKMTAMPIYGKNHSNDFFHMVKTIQMTSTPDPPGRLG